MCFCFTQAHISTALVTFILAIIAKYLFYTILSISLCGREALPVILREEDRLRLCDKRVLRSIFRPKRNNQEPGKNYTLGNFTICIFSPDIVRV